MRPPLAPPHHLQSIESSTLKSFLGLGKKSGGVLITRVSPVSSLAGTVLERDVLTALDGHPIADDGTIAFPSRPQERISFRYLLTRNKYIGDKISLALVRGGKPLTLQMALEDVPDLVPHSLHDAKPSYLVRGVGHRAPRGGLGHGRAFPLPPLHSHATPLLLRRSTRASSSLSSQSPT